MPTEKTELETELAGDIIRGMDRICDFVGVPLRKGYYLASRGLIPGVGKEGETWIGLKSEILAGYRAKARGGKIAG